MSMSSSSLMSSLACELSDARLSSALSLLDARRAQMDRVRRRAVDELVDSEQRYLQQLQLLKDSFVAPIGDRGLMSDVELKASFGHLETVLQVNKELLECLRRAGPNEEQLGSVFLRLAPFLRFYSTYAQDLQTSLHTLQRLQNERGDLQDFISQQERVTNHAFNALLITPVQRIPRYRMLLQDIVDNVANDDDDTNNSLNLAVKMVEDVAWHMNQHLGDHEKALRLLDIQKSLQGSVNNELMIKPGRKLIRDGILMKVSRISGDKGQERFFLLCNDCIIYCKIKADISKLPKANALEWCCCLPLKRCQVEPLVGKGVFKLTCVNEELILFPSNKSNVHGDNDEDENTESCSSNNNSLSWLDTIAEAIGQHKKDAATLRKESSKKRPMRRPEMLKMRKESLRLIMLNQNRGHNGSSATSPLKQLWSLRKRTASSNNTSTASSHEMKEEIGSKKRRRKGDGNNTEKEGIDGTLTPNRPAAGKSHLKELTPVPSRSTSKEASLLRSLQTKKIGKKYEGLKKNRRNSAKDSLDDTGAVFRSPSLNVEPKNSLMQVYLKDDFGPLASPSQLHTDVKHLALQQELRQRIGAEDSESTKTKSERDGNNESSLFNSCLLM